MKAIVTTLSEIMKRNRRLCLSAKRGLGLCYECPSFLSCESRLIPDFILEKLRRVIEIRKEMESLHDKIEELRDECGIDTSKWKRPKTKGLRLSERMERSLKGEFSNVNKLF